MSQGAMLNDFEWVPNGCRHHSDCFTCPFDDCIDGILYKEKVTMSRAVRNQAHALYRQGKTAKEVMAELGVSQVTAYRYRRSMA